MCLTPVKNVTNLITQGNKSVKSTIEKRNLLEVSQGMDLQTSWNSVSFKPVSSVFADDAPVIANSEDGGGGIKTPVGFGDTRTLAHQNSAARCLFSPERLPVFQRKPRNDFCTPIRRRFYQKCAIPSFDTPNRSSLSPSELSKKFRGFILGRGSYGVVVKGSYKDKTVAVKIIPKTDGRCFNRSLSREMNAVGLKHPNIVEVIKVIEQPDSDLGFVLMELNSKKNLEDLLDTLIPLKVKLKYLRETADALEYCHSRGVLHLDVKPKNMIINLSSNSCKLCDFGSSVHVSETRTIHSPTKGTLKYCAPELLQGLVATEKADVYSFGITMWQLINEKTPFDKEDLHVVVYRVVTQNYRPDNHLTMLNNTVESTYKSCWETDPNKRPSISSVKAILNAI